MNESNMRKWMQRRMKARPAVDAILKPPTNGHPAKAAKLKIHDKPKPAYKASTATSWNVDVVHCVGDKVILALSRAYGYKGKDVGKAADVLAKNDIDCVPF